MPSWDDDTLSDDELRRSIKTCKARGMELELEELAKSLVPTEEYKKGCQKAVLFLKSAFSQEFLQKGAPLTRGSARIAMAGSAMQNTELEGSDLDVVCSGIPGSFDEREVKMARFWDKLHSPPHSNNLEAMDATRLFPHATCQLSVRLRAAPKLLAHVIVDDNPSPEALDAAIRQLCDCFDASRDVIRLVKFWATNHGLSEQHEGYMNGVAWAAFVLCFLQRQQHVPPLAQLGDSTGGPKTKVEKPERNLTELLRGFFQFVCAPQPTTPRGMSLEGADCTAAPPPSSHVGPPPPLYIEDPISAKQGIRRNLASTLGEAQWARILEESRRIADRLDPEKPQRWFYWAEVFDPQGLSGSGKRLPKLSEMSESSADGAPQAAPNQAAPNQAAPNQAVPNQAVPNQAVPNQAVPNQAVPNQAVPNQAVPNQAVPNQAVPNQAVPNQAVPNQAVPNQAVPNQAVPNQAVPNQAVPNHAAPNQAVPNQVMPKQVVMKQAFPNQAAPSLQFSVFSGKGYAESAKAAKGHAQKGGQKGLLSGF